MLKYFGRLTCPRCATGLVYELDIACRVLPGDLPADDQRWLCPNCGFSRPIVYAIEREQMAAVASGSRFMRAVRPLLNRYR